MKRVVSLVPSWTETLIEAGASVVGRTRFCVHPGASIGSIPVVGGTKSLDVQKIRALDPDVILLDREENTLEMFETAKTIASAVVTHVENVRDLPRELGRLAAIFDGEKANGELRAMAARYQDALGRKKPVLHKGCFVYCIWKDPWMAIGKNTFIASMLEQSGYSLDDLWPRTEEKYPKFDLASLSPEARVLLSSEPYPFSRQVSQLADALQPRTVELVDGESFSWFGIRALRFLESQ